MEKLVTAESIDQLADEMKEFSRQNFGLKFGEEFAPVARAFVSSTAGAGLLSAAVALGMLSTLMIAPPKSDNAANSETDSKQRMDRLMKDDNPFREMLAEVFYMGYRCGKTAVEITTLETLNR